jgi:hypothetical protein
MTNVSRIAALRALGRHAEASKLIVAAMRRAKGSKRLAAAELGVTAATLYRQIAELELWSALDGLAKSQGWRRRAGRARGPVTSAMVLALCVFGIACEPVNSDAAPNNPMDMSAAAGSAPYMGAAGSGAIEQDAGEPWVTVTYDAGAKPTERADAGTTQPTAAGMGGGGTGGSKAPAAGSSGSAAAAGTGAAGSTPPTAGTSAPAGAPAPPPPHLTQCRLDVGGVVGCNDPNLTMRSDFQLQWAIDPSKPISGSNSTLCTGPNDPATASQCVPGARCAFIQWTGDYFEEGTCI